MKTVTMALMAAIILIMPTTSFANAGPRQTHQVLDRPFLELLGFLEGPDGYNDITGFTNRRPVKPVTSMTINEVLEFQMMLRQQGTESSAMGRYQFIYKTLNYLTNEHGIDRNRLFDRTMQDHLARLEMERCGFYDTSTSVPELGNCLARIWAALPILTGKNHGKSRYRGTGINFAQTSPQVIEAILRNRVVEYRPQTYQPKKPGFNVSTETFRGYQAPPNAMPPEATTPSSYAPWTTIRPKARPKR